MSNEIFIVLPSERSLKNHFSSPAPWVMYGRESIAQKLKENQGQEPDGHYRIFTFPGLEEVVHADISLTVRDDG